MNRIYRLVWSKSSQALVVASELASSGKESCGASATGKVVRLLSLALLAASCGVYASSAQAGSSGDTKMDDLQALMARYDAAPSPSVVAAAAVGRTSIVAATNQPVRRALAPTVAAPRVVTAGVSRAPARAAVTVDASARASVAGLPAAGRPGRSTTVQQAPSVDHRAVVAGGEQRAVALATAGFASSPAVLAMSATSPVPAIPESTAAPIAAVSPDTRADRRRTPAIRAAQKPASTDDEEGAALAIQSTAVIEGRPMALSSVVPLSVTVSAPASGLFAHGHAVSPAAVPQVPMPTSFPTGMIVGNGGVVGTATQLLGSSINSLFNNTDGYVASGSLRVSSANFTQGYSTLSLLGVPLLNLTPVGTLLHTAGGAFVGGTGINSHLTLIGGVSSGSYISNINNGAPGGLLGLVLPGAAPAWASECLNVLNVLVKNCWGVNAAQDYQVLVGDGASANGSKEVVIGTGAHHTLPTMSADEAFPGAGRNDPNNPSGVPTADYTARLGHSVVIGDSASGTANAQTILGAQATSSVANSVALGYQSAANRGAQSNYASFGLGTPQNSAGEVSVGAVGQERQITNVAAGSAATDVATVGQMAGLADGMVEYDDASKATVTLGGIPSVDGGVTDGTTISNLHRGVLGADSTDAVNGSQLFGTNQSLADFMGGVTHFDPATNAWTAPIFPITSVAPDGSTSVGDYDNVTDAFAAVDGSVVNVNNRIDHIDNGGGIKYFRSNSALADSTASGVDSVAVGPEALASGSGSVAMGHGASAGGVDALAFGTGADAGMANSIALGAGSVTAVGALVDYAAYGLTAAQTSTGEVNVGQRQITGVAAGAAAGDAVNMEQLQAVGGQLASVDKLAVKYDTDATGEATNTVTLTGDGSGAAVGIGNLADGRVAAGSLEAINGGQLFATNTAVTSYFGGTTNFDSTTGDWIGPVFPITSVAIDGSTTTGDYTNVTDAFAAVDGSVVNLNSRIDNIDNGGGIKYFHSNSTLGDSTASGTDSVAVGPVATASGTGSVAMGHAASATADDALAFGSGAQAGMGNSVALGAGSVTAVGALTDYAAYALGAPQTSAGELNVGNRQITGVAAGAAADDAVNVAQLEAVDSRVNSIDQLAVKYDADASGTATNRISLRGDGSGALVGITQLAAGAETALSTDAVNGSQLWHWTQNLDNIYSNINLYNEIKSIIPGGSVKYFNVNSTLADFRASGSDSVAIGPVAEASGTDSVAIGHGATASADNAVAIGAGSVADRADSVSVGHAGGERQITNVAAGTAATDAVNVGQMQSTVTAAQEGAVRYDTHTDGSVDYHNVSLGNGTGDTTIHNVAAGVADTDAVNVQQFKDGMQQTVNWANAYTDQRFEQLNGRIDQVGNRASAGVAAAMAMAGLPQAYEPGKSMAAVAGGTFRGESSLAIGVSAISEGGRWVYKLTGSTNTRGDAGVTVGAGIQW